MNPKIIFTDDQWKLIENAATIFCTGEEIAGLLQVDYDTLNSRILEKHNIATSEYIKNKSANGRQSLRRAQYKKAMAGNPTMLIWLGKQYLDQRDKSEITGADGQPFKVIIESPLKGILNGVSDTTSTAI